jgi:hypothetical protein
LIAKITGLFQGSARAKRLFLFVNLEV